VALAVDQVGLGTGQIHASLVSLYVDEIDISWLHSFFFISCSEIKGFYGKVGSY
jgi:hypothetical protein